MNDCWFDDNNWESALTWDTMYLQGDFPVSDFEYQNSLWETWVLRIQEGHKAEEEKLKELYYQLKPENHEEDSEEAVEINHLMADGHTDMAILTNSMYAALAVSLWSKMENFFKRMINVCFIGQKKKESILKSVTDFCAESSSNPVNKSELKRCIKLLRALQTAYKFLEIKSFFKNEMGIDLEVLPEYKTVDAIRILNNSYKHSNGYYKPEIDKSHTQIDPTLLAHWSVQCDQEIDYSKLPIKELVIACGKYNQKLIDEIRSKLKSLSQSSSSGT